MFCNKPHLSICDFYLTGADDTLQKSFFSLQLCVCVCVFHDSCRYRVFRTTRRCICSFIFVFFCYFFFVSETGSVDLHVLELPCRPFEESFSSPKKGFLFVPPSVLVVFLVLINVRYLHGRGLVGGTTVFLQNTTECSEIERERERERERDTLRERERGKTKNLLMIEKVWKNAREDIFHKLGTHVGAR